MQILIIQSKITDFCRFICMKIQNFKSIYANVFSDIL